MGKTKVTAKIIEKFGDKVRKERLERDMSQETLAMKAGIHRTYVGMIERGETNVTISNIENVAKGLGMRVRDLFDF